MKKPAPAPSPDDPSQRLLAAALEQIEQHGLAQLTVRGVAAAAGVNIAAVNYYFRSKEALVTAVIEGAIRHMVQDSDEYLARLPGDPEAVLVELLGYYLEGALRYPRITKAALHDAFLADDYQGPFPTLFGPVMQRLSRLLREATPNLDERSAGRRVVAMLSSVYFPAFFLGLYAPLGALDTPADRSAYVRELARTALAPVEGGKGGAAPRGKRASKAEGR